jgi:endogenous inhibitor of DNA gyrase (YacG/DUF329 family)
MPSRSCAWCGETFDFYPSQPRRFCSRDCYLAEQQSDYAEVECSHCGATVERPRWHVEQNKKRHFCDKDCEAAWLSEQRGADSPAWNGGYDEVGQGSTVTEWREVRAEALDRDGWACAACGLSDGAHRVLIGQGLDVHHADPDGPKFDAANLLSLCRTCHPGFDR